MVLIQGKQLHKHHFSKDRSHTQQKNGKDGTHDRQKHSQHLDWSTLAICDLIGHWAKSLLCEQEHGVLS